MSLIVTDCSSYDPLGGSYKKEQKLWTRTFFERKRFTRINQLIVLWILPLDLERVEEVQLNNLHTHQAKQLPHTGRQDLVKLKGRSAVRLCPVDGS